MPVITHFYFGGRVFRTENSGFRLYVDIFQGTYGTVTGHRSDSYFISR